MTIKNNYVNSLQSLNNIDNLGMSEIWMTAVTPDSSVSITRY